MTQENDLEVAILAGGQSRRMGTNKALLRAHAGGLMLIEIVAERLREADLAPTLLVTNTPEEYVFLGLPCVRDSVEDAGALGGILTALAHSAHLRTLIVACDMPLLSPALLRYMAVLADSSDAIVPRWRNENGLYHVEPLHSIYSQRCVQPILQQIAAGQLRVIDLLDRITVRWVEEEEIRRCDPALLSFRNVNTPEEWAEIEMRSED